MGGSYQDDVNSKKQTSDGGYIIAGLTDSNDGDVSGNHGDYDSWVVKLSSSGAIQWQKCLGGSDYDGASSIQQTSDGGYIVAGGTMSNDGDVSGNHGGADFWVVKLSLVNGIEELTAEDNLIKVYPNPATDKIFVKAKENSLSEITNMQGQVILSKKLSDTQSIDISSLAKGIYFYRITENNKLLQTGKIVKQ